MNSKMNSWRHFGASAALLLALSLPALARDAAAPGNPAAPQVGQQRGGGRQAGISGVPIPVIDLLVTLKPEQKTKVTAIHAKLKEDTKAATGDRQKLGELRTQANTDVKAVLTPEQAKTLDDAMPMLNMLNQSRVAPYGVMPEVKLTKDQMDKIQTIAGEEAAKVKGVARADRRAKTQEVIADFKTRVDPILTAEQKDIIAKYEENHKSTPSTAGGAN